MELTEAFSGGWVTWQSRCWLRRAFIELEQNDLVMVCLVVGTVFCDIELMFCVFVRAVGKVRFLYCLHGFRILEFWGFFTSGFQLSFTNSVISFILIWIVLKIYIFWIILFILHTFWVLVLGLYLIVITIIASVVNEAGYWLELCEWHSSVKLGWNFLACVRFC